MAEQSFEEAKRIHGRIIDAMGKLGYGLLLDGDTFYTLGYELDPHSNATFTMRQAYSLIATNLADKQAYALEVLEGLKARLAPSGMSFVEIDEEEAMTVIDQAIANINGGGR